MKRESGRTLGPIMLAAFLLIASATSLADGLTPGDVARQRNVSAAAISPNGAHVAYTLSVPRLPGQGEDGPPWSELHVTDLDGRSRPFIAGKVNISRIAWTPDGRGISFTAKLAGDEHACLYVIPIDGGQARQVVTHTTEVRAYDWSPDGKRVAFLATRKKDDEKKKLADKGFKAKVYEEEFEPVRVYIAAAHSGTSDSETTDPASQGPRGAEPRELDLDGSASDVAWSPAGDELAVRMSATPLVDDDMMFSRVRIVDVGAGRVVGELETVGKLGDGCWSPDGKHIALIAAADINDPREGRLVVGSARGGPVRDLLPGYLGHVVALAWQDSDTIMYVAQRGVRAVLAKINADGSEQKSIVDGDGPILDSISLSGDGLSGVFLADAPAHPHEVFYMRHGDASPRRLTTSNAWLAQRRLARQEVITFKARDGLELEGILTYPLDHQPAQRYPLVMIVHGGPEAHESQGWRTFSSRPTQVLAARGFAVFETNYRGSTARGVEFSKLGQHDPAGKEFDDVIDAVDHLVRVGLADEKRVGVTGGSYGGYATAWCCTRFSDRFAAGVMNVGVSDLLTQWGTSDIPRENYLVHMRAWPWENWTLFEERSPLRHVQNCRTPLLILHGEDDPRVHPANSLMLYRYLKLLDQAPVRLVLYPGEGHGNRKAAARYDYCLRLLQWMEHYLKGPGGGAPPDALEYALEQFEASDD